MFLEINEYGVRPYREEDIPTLAQRANNRKIWQNLRDGFPHPYTEGDAREWIEMANHQDPITAFAVVKKRIDDVIGGIGIIPGKDVYRFNGEIGYWLAEPWWGNGIMTRVVKEFSDFAFDHFQLTRLSACIYEWNPASIRVLEKAGFQQEGIERKSVYKDGRLLDAYRYARIKKNYGKP